MISRLSSHAAFRQLVKFCIVGASSTVVDKGLLRLLMFVLLPHVALPVNQSISFCLGVTNGYIWNRLWTFNSVRAADPKRQFGIFVATNVVGLALNLLITQVFVALFSRAQLHPDSKELQYLASLCAIPIVVVWNFSAAKFLTFRAPKPAAPSEPVSEPALRA